MATCAVDYLALAYGPKARGAYVVGGATAFLVLLIGVGVALSPNKSATEAKDSTASRGTTSAPVVPATTVTSTKPTPKPKPKAVATPTPNKDVETHTREYIAGVQTCQVGLGLVLLDIKRGESDPIKLADAATQGRDVCDSERSQLVAMDTDHFVDEAALAWNGVDRAKSGLNAMLAYLDNPAPSKLIEVRDKLAEGDRDMAEGIRQINARRHVYGLKAIT